MTLKASKGVSLSEAGQALIKSLPFDFQRLSELSHMPGKAIARLPVRSKMLDFSSQCGVVLIEEGPVDAPCQFEIWVEE